MSDLLKANNNIGVIWPPRKENTGLSITFYINQDISLMNSVLQLKPAEIEINEYCPDN